MKLAARITKFRRWLDQTPFEQRYAQAAKVGTVRSPAIPPTEQERFQGCLLGGAVGDALGAPVEFLRRDAILRLYGPEGVTQYESAYGGWGRITDDSQMTLFTAEGLLRGWVQRQLRGESAYAAAVAHAYLCWLHTQDEHAICAIQPATERSWLLQQPQLHSRRAPGTTCLSALKAMPELGLRARNDSKGCGGVMRAAPVGLFVSRLGVQAVSEKAFRLGVSARR